MYFAPITTLVVVAYAVACLQASSPASNDGEALQKFGHAKDGGGDGGGGDKSNLLDKLLFEIFGSSIVNKEGMPSEEGSGKAISANVSGGQSLDMEQLDANERNDLDAKELYDKLVGNRELRANAPRIRVMTAAPPHDSVLCELNENELRFAGNFLADRLSLMVERLFTVPKEINELTGFYLPVTQTTTEKECVLQCISRRNHTAQAGHGCTELRELMDCVSSCPSSPFADYVNAMKSRLASQYCSQKRGNSKNINAKPMLGIITECIDRTFSDMGRSISAAQHALNCYAQFEEANDNADTCMVLKNCVVDGTAQKLGDWCGQSEETSLMIQHLRYHFIVYITRWSAGNRLMEECPALYIP